MLTREAYALLNQNYPSLDNLKPQHVESAAQVIKRLFRAEMPVLEPVKVNKWAAQMSEIRKSCSRLTEEEVRLYECTAMTSWECR